MNKVYEYRLSRTDDWIRVYSPEISISRPKGDYEVEVRYRCSVRDIGASRFNWLSFHLERKLYRSGLNPFFGFVLSVLLLFLVGLLLATRRQYIKCERGNG